MQSSVENDLAQAKRVWLEKNRQVSAKPGEKKKEKNRQVDPCALLACNMFHQSDIKIAPSCWSLAAKVVLKKALCAVQDSQWTEKRPNNIFFVRARCLSAGHGT